MNWQGLQSDGSPVAIEPLNVNGHNEWLELKQATIGKVMVFQNLVFVPLFDNEKNSSTSLGIYTPKWLAFTNITGTPPAGTISLMDYLLITNGELYDGPSSALTISIIIISVLAALGLIAWLFVWYVVRIHRTKVKNITDEDLTKVNKI